MAIIQVNLCELEHPANNRRILLEQNFTALLTAISAFRLGEDAIIPLSGVTYTTSVLTMT